MLSTQIERHQDNVTVGVVDGSWGSCVTQSVGTLRLRHHIGRGPEVRQARLVGVSGSDGGGIACML